METQEYFRKSMIPCSKFIFFSRGSAWKLTVSYNFRNYLSYPWALIVEMRIFSVEYVGERIGERRQHEREDRPSLQLISDQAIVIDNRLVLCASSVNYNTSAVVRGSNDQLHLIDVRFRFLCHHCLPECQRWALKAHLPKAFSSHSLHAAGQNCPRIPLLGTDAALFEIFTE